MALNGFEMAFLRRQNGPDSGGGVGCDDGKSLCDKGIGESSRCLRPGVDWVLLAFSVWAAISARVEVS